MDNKRISFGRIPSVIDIPDLLGIQTETFEDFVQLDTHPLKREIKGLQQVFLTNFPIFDNKENYSNILIFQYENQNYSDNMPYHRHSRTSVGQREDIHQPGSDHTHCHAREHQNG